MAREHPAVPAVRDGPVSKAHRGEASAIIFVVGTGRCGTHTVTRLFHNAGIDAAHEPSDVNLRTVELASAYSHGTISHSLAVDLLADMPVPEVTAHFKLSELIAPLSEVHPEARWLWVTRNPYDTVRSMVVAGWYAPEDDSWLPGCRTFLTADGVKRELNYPGNRTRADRVGDMPWSVWGQLRQWQRCCWWWQWCNTRVGESLQGRDWFRLDIDNPDIAGLSAWAGVPLGPLPHTNRSGVSLTDVDRDKIGELTGPVAQALGY